MKKICLGISILLAAINFALCASIVPSGYEYIVLVLGIIGVVISFIGFFEKNK